jgi:hypothetical protein
LQELKRTPLIHVYNNCRKNKRLASLFFIKYVTLFGDEKYVKLLKESLTA